MVKKYLIFISLLCSKFVSTYTETIPTNVDEMNKVMKDKGCGDQPIKNIFVKQSNSSKHFVAIKSSKNTSLSMSFEKIKDNLPKVRPDSPLKPLNISLDDAHDLEEYELRDNSYFLKLGGNKYKLIGSDLQVWIGCPQQICTSGGFDAVIYDYWTGAVHVFRGYFYWELVRVPLHSPFSKAKSIDFNWIVQNGSPINGFVDAILSVPDGKGNANSIYIFKGSKVWKFLKKSNPGSEIDVTEKYFNNYFKKVDAAFYISHTDSYYFFEGSNLWNITTNSGFESGVKSSELLNISELNNNFPTKIDAAYHTLLENDLIYFFFDWQYFTIKAKDFVKFVFKDIIECDDNSYAKWGFKDYESFISNYASKSIIHDYIPETTSHPATTGSDSTTSSSMENSEATHSSDTQNEKKSNRDNDTEDSDTKVRNFVIIILVAIVFFLIIMTAIIFIVTRLSKSKQRPHSSRRLLLANKKSSPKSDQQNERYSRYAPENRSMSSINSLSTDLKEENSAQRLNLLNQSSTQLTPNENSIMKTRCFSTTDTIKQSPVQSTSIDQKTNKSESKSKTESVEAKKNITRFFPSPDQMTSPSELSISPNKQITKR